MGQERNPERNIVTSTPPSSDSSALHCAVQCCRHHPTSRRIHQARSGVHEVHLDLSKHRPPPCWLSSRQPRILELVLVHTYIEVIYHSYTTTYIHIHTLRCSYPQSVYLLPAAAESREKHLRCHSRSRFALDCIGHCNVVVVTERRL